MRTIKVLAIIGLAVALVAVPALAASRVVIKISGTAQAGDLFIQIDSRNPVKVTLTANQAIKDIRDKIVTELNGQQSGTAERGAGDDQLIITKADAIKIGEAQDKLTSLPFEASKSVQARGLTFTVVEVKTVPTLTEWGLIALAVLLAGGMGYMIYRRRPALRPAAP